jgi:hypothetical protein
VDPAVRAFLMVRLVQGAERLLSVHLASTG